MLSTDTFISLFTLTIVSLLTGFAGDIILFRKKYVDAGCPAVPSNTEWAATFSKAKKENRLAELQSSGWGLFKKSIEMCKPGEDFSKYAQAQSIATAPEGMTDRLRAVW